MNGDGDTTMYGRTPEDIRGIEARLERLGAHERGGPGAGFEAGLMEAVRRGRSPGPLAFVRARRVPLALGGMLAAAAAVGAAAVLWSPRVGGPAGGPTGGPFGVPGMPGTVATVSFAEQVEDVLALLDGVDGVGALSLEASLVGDDLEGAWLGAEEFGLSGSGEEGLL